MKKTINTKTKKINVIYGFFNDNNYGVDYPKLTETIELTDLLPYINKGEVDIAENYLLWRTLYRACRDITNHVDEYTIYMEARTLKHEPTLAVTFRIVKNAA